jgi:hypothetical protein
MIVSSALVFFMIIIPIIFAFSFIFSKLLSLLGNRSSVDTIVNGVKSTANTVKINTMKAADLLSKTPSMFSKGPGLVALEKAAGTELIGKSLQK